MANPSDILSLLLLIGGDIVQKAIAQLVGYKIRLPGRTKRNVSIAPVAFSFGWIFFPAGLNYNDESIRDNKHKKFWRRAYHTKSTRKLAEEKRRAEENKPQLLQSV
ncbi:hypothetical protein F5B21DRAFT_507574 [Xylaria acuta]|nr:hypothetical protein F5B21DRAFT_507574 [Xylaria acuta]